MNRRTFLQCTAALAAAGLAGRFARAGSPVAGDGPLDAAAFHAQRRYVRVPQGDIACIERGTGEAALFLHGLPLNSFQWRGALERLSPWRRCIAPDLLGLGYTRVRPGQAVTPDAQVAMLLALLERLGVDRFDLVASDSGGAVGQLLAARHPQRIRTLLLANCDTDGECPPAAMLPVIRMAHEGTFVQRWLARWLADKALARSPQGLGGMTYTFPERLADATLEVYLAPLVRHPQRTHAYVLGLERNPLAGIGPQLQRCRAPARILWGTGDDIFSAAGAAYLDHHLGGSQGVRTVPGAKLFFPEEFPDLVAEEARRLWGVG